MTAYRRTARLLALGAALSTTAGLYTAARSSTPWLCLPGLYAAVVFAWCAARYTAAHHRALAEREWERQYAYGRNPAPLDPCCALARHSGGAGHDRRCTDPTQRLTTPPNTDLWSHS